MGWDIASTVLKRLLLLDLPKGFCLPTLDSVYTPMGFNDEQRAMRESQVAPLVAPTSDDDWKHVLECKRKTSAGMTGISPNLLLETPVEMHARIRALIDFCIARGVFPPVLGNASVAMLLKSGKPMSWENMRPIALCENLGKLITRVLARRMKKLEIATRYDTNPLFRLGQSAFRSQMGTSDNIQTLNGVLETAKLRKLALHIINTDIAKAYDSCEFWSLQMHYRRKGMPEAFCNLMSSMDQCQTQRILTSYGLTDEYRLTRGCRQGETLSCVRWLFLVDPLIEWLETVSKSCGFEVGPGLNVHNSTFADDFTLISGSNTGVQIMLTMQNAFFAAHGVTISAPKSIYVFRDYARNKASTPLSWSQPHLVDPFTGAAAPVQTIGTKTPFRVLGVYFTLDLDWRPQKQMLEDKLTEALGRMRRVRFPLDFAVKTVNSVIIPQIEYALQMPCVSHPVLVQWDRLIVATCKKVGGFPL
jgi:hypothetical protein